MRLKEDAFEIPIPGVDSISDLTLDDIEHDTVDTPEENGVSTMLINSIADTWNKINDYNSILTTISSLSVDGGEDIYSIIKDVVDEENKNVGRLMSALELLSPNIQNVEVGAEEVNMKLTESLEDEKVRQISDILERSLSASQINYIYDDWRGFYNDPESFSYLSEVINQCLDDESMGEDDIDELTLDSYDFHDDYDDEEDDIGGQGDQVVIDDDFFEESLKEDVQKPIEKKPNIIGTIRYDANEGRKKRISLYKKLVSLNEDAQLTEESLKDWAVNRVACFTNTVPERVREELLGHRWSEFEEE